MSLVHEEQILFGGYTHSDMMKGPYDKPVKIGAYAMLKGESHLVSPRKGRDLWCEVDAIGYPTESGLLSAVTAIQNLAELPLTGTLVLTWITGRTGTYSNCTFLGVDERDEIQFDPSDNTYWQPLTFKWRQAL